MVEPQGHNVLLPEPLVERDEAVDYPLRQTILLFAEAGYNEMLLELQGNLGAFFFWGLEEACEESAEELREVFCGRFGLANLAPGARARAHETACAFFHALFQSFDVTVVGITKCADLCILQHCCV